MSVEFLSDKWFKNLEIKYPNIVEIAENRGVEGGADLFILPHGNCSFIMEIKTREIGKDFTKRYLEKMMKISKDQIKKIRETRRNSVGGTLLVFRDVLPKKPSEEIKKDLNRAFQIVDAECFERNIRYPEVYFVAVLYVNTFDKEIEDFSVIMHNISCCSDEFSNQFHKSLREFVLHRANCFLNVLLQEFGCKQKLNILSGEVMPPLPKNQKKLDLFLSKL